MKKQNLILSAALAAVFSASTAFAEAEVTGKIVHESAKFTTSGTTIGAAAAHDKDVMKTETSARIYIDGEINEVNEGSTYHVELNLMRDSKGVGDYDSNESYTQRDALREAYVDSQVGDWSLRTGKQQVVWGTADGMKLLDMINPSDYSEMAQNQMEDSRIPVWMVNAETTNADGSELQVIISQPKENVFAGMNRNINTAVRSNTDTRSDSTDYGDTTLYSDDTTADGHNQGHAFLMKGVDSITGKSNGFVNIVPDMGAVAQTFWAQYGGGSVLSGYKGLTVGAYTNGAVADADGNGNASSGAFLLGAVGITNPDTNLLDSATYDSANADSAFEYMSNATFATFDAFVGAKSQYKYNMPSGSDLDIATRVKRTLDNGLNYSLNYSYNYDKNPIINMSWRDANGVEVAPVVTTLGWNAGGTGVGTAYYTDTVSLAGQGGSAGERPTLQFEQTVKRAHNLGSALDYAIDTESLGPVVLRGEFLYQKDVYSPVMDLGQLSIGNLTEALKMEKGDRFKYVLGADITALTNMMISAQFIQDRNLDYIDEIAATNSSANAVTGSRFTSDYATMSLTNNFNKAEENKEFYSLFFSKPFGASGEHRWNNIFMFEENGGKWNRLDAEFSINDDTQATVEYNKYWGDANTQFGQLEKSSNIQVGVKYSF